MKWFEDPPLEEEEDELLLLLLLDDDDDDELTDPSITACLALENSWSVMTPR
jgi:hypothetical protein